MSDELEEEFEEDEDVDPFEGDSPDEENLEDVDEDEIFDDDAIDEDSDDVESDGVEEDDDEIEADLSDILKERITAEDDKDDEETTDAKTEDGEKVNVVTKQEDEIHCPSCFLLVSQAAIDQDGECPHCGARV